MNKIICSIEMLVSLMRRTRVSSTLLLISNGIKAIRFNNFSINNYQVKDKINNSKVPITTI